MDKANQGAPAARNRLGERLNPPSGWHAQKDGQLVCPHRDLSVCPDCVAANPEVMESYGAHFWVPPSMRDDGEEGLR